MFLCIMLSFFVFPLNFAFLPKNLNTKMMLAVYGIVAFVYDRIQKHSFSFSKTTTISSIWAILFSIWCYYCIVANGTDDTSYAQYWLSFATWLGGAYAVCSLIKSLHGRIDLESLTFYLTLVCVLQCILALLIDNIPSFQHWVDTYVIQGQALLHKINRLYGIGASLDPAGVRFSVILIMMAHQMSSYGTVMGNTGMTLYYFISFAIIVVIGSMISRTTWTGGALGIIYMVFSYMKVRRGAVSSKQNRFWALLVGITVLSVIIITWFYNHNPDFRSSFRFGFEGFFNLVENGTFRTDSTDKLNSTMWIWPKDTRSWTIGTGLFEGWIFGTDIGYCRFVLYCGLIGMVIFSLFFIYIGLSIIPEFENSTVLALLLISLTFIIWIKVSTDIYFIYALMFSTSSLQNKPCASSIT